MNSIESLTHEDGNEVANHIDLCDIANVYFNNMYVTSSVDIDPIINSIPSYTLFANNISLIAPFSIEEFKDALFSMFSNQSPSPDGLNLSTKDFGIFMALIFFFSSYILA